ncbi:hypothetical protein EDC01DRAFT_421124 [Geopyxis carbonaria]|nr:hypothetical protein EDC01DRAFT_421124 [Geopyxis carbonaria]
MATVSAPPRPNDIVPKEEEVDDDDLINKFLSGGGDFADATGTEISFGDTVGKVDDAVDYEDISDDDLPSEDEGPTGDMDMQSEDLVEDLVTAEDVQMDGDFDDLFGDMEPTSDPVVPVDEDLDLGMDGVSFDFDGADAAQIMSGDGSGLDSAQDLFRSMDFGVSDEQMDSVSRVQQASPEELARQYFPDFRPHSVLSFSSLFKPKPGALQSAPSKVPKVLVPTKLCAEMAVDDANIFLKAATATNRVVATSHRDKRIVVVPPPVEEISEDDKDQDEDEDTSLGLGPEFDRDLEIACGDWDKCIEAAMVTPPSSPVAMLVDDENEEMDDFDDIISPATKRRKLETPVLPPRYLDCLPRSWLDEEAIYEGDLSKLAGKIILDLNDPHLLVDVRQPNEVRRTRRIGGEFKRRVNRDLTQRYNISNDEAYDLLKENHQNKVRSTIGQLNIEHALPALRLQSPYYKTKLSTKESRSFHRPNLHFHVDQEIRFDKIKYRKRKTYRNKEIQEVFATTKDMSLSDGSNFILLEYSEEYPTVMSNFGMGSRLINYYRRKGPDDESRPKLDIGETQVLMSQDRSPFWNFGTVDPGETVLTLYNKMVRAPIFKQAPKSTDFLVVRSSYENASRYYLRTIPHMYVVGQLFPVTEVPGPHSRKVTTAAKNRLKMICYRVVKRKSERAIAVKDISTHFPENNDMQNRQKMKEFMSYQKTNGMWEMKAGEGMPDEATIRSMIKPEDLCLLEAMQVGVRNLEDSGYAKTVEDDDDGEKDGMSLEQQLTPWVSTKNFINATQGKAMLQLHGEGDPSGRGEAFSFVRTSMKGGFKDVGESIDEKMDKQRLKELGGHSYNVARQQKQYEEAIDRIWRAQYKSLSSAEELPDVDIEDAHRDDHPADDLFEEGRTPRSEGAWMNFDDETTSQFSRMSAKTQSRKVLKITRKIQNKHGEVETKVEVVRDAKVIRQYLQRRREMDAEKTHIEALVPTGNAEEDNINRKRLMIELARLQRNKERREARERQSGKRFMGSDAMSPEGTSPGSPMMMAPQGKQATTRKCANCGQAGHIRKCPNEYVPEELWLP